MLDASAAGDDTARRRRRRRLDMLGGRVGDGSGGGLQPEVDRHIRRRNLHRRPLHLRRRRRRWQIALLHVLDDVGLQRRLGRVDDPRRQTRLEQLDQRNMENDDSDEKYRALGKERCVVSCVGSHTRNRNVFTDPTDGQSVEHRNVNTFCAARKPVPDQIFEPSVHRTAGRFCSGTRRPDSIRRRAQVRNAVPRVFY